MPAALNENAPVPQCITDKFRYRKDLGLLFEPATGIFHKLETDSARSMYEMALKQYTIRQIADNIADDFDAPVEEILDDIQDYFALLAHLESNSGSAGWHNIDKGFDHALDFPLRMEIELTSVCNWNCGFCYNVWKIDPELSDSEVRKKIREYPERHMPKDMAFKIIDECADRGCFIMRYSGGEPLLHPEALEILEYGARRRLHQVLFTNGHFLTEALVGRLAEANVRAVLISIHGDKRVHNRLAGHKHAYDRAINAMRLAVGAGIDVVAEATLVQENAHGILDIIRDVYGVGVRQFGVMRYVPTGKNDEEYAVPQSEMLPLMEKIHELKQQSCPDIRVGWPCGQKFCTSADDEPISHGDPTLNLRFEQLTGHCESGITWGSVSFDGRVRNCPHSNVYFGDYRGGIQSAWETMTQAVAKAVAPRASCGGCAVSEVCRGGCHLPHFIQDAKSGNPLTMLPMPRLQVGPLDAGATEKFAR